MNISLLQYYSTNIIPDTSSETCVLHPRTGQHGRRRRGGTPHPLPFCIWCCDCPNGVRFEVTVGSSLKNSEDQNEEDTAECVGPGPHLQDRQTHAYKALLKRCEMRGWVLMPFCARQERQLIQPGRVCVCARTLPDPIVGGRGCRMMLTPSTVCSDEEEAGLPWSCLESIERRAHDTVVSSCCVLCP